MSHNDDFETLAAVHAVGALDGEDRMRLEAHLAEGCAQCERVLREGAEALARVTPAPRELPPAHVRRELLARLDATAPRPLPETRRWLPRAAAIAAAMLIAAGLGAGFMATHYEKRLGVAVREAATMRERLARQDQALHEQVRLHAELAELLRDPGTRVVAMQGTGPSPQAVGRVVWHETHGGHVFVANLPAPPAGRIYELWAITGGTPRPAGLFAPDASGKARHTVAPVGKVDLFAVTLEPAGGVPAPTGPIVLASAK